MSESTIASSSSSRIAGEQAADAEIQALSGIVKLLDPLKPDARERVIAYVSQRLAIAPPNASTSAPKQLPLATPAEQQSVPWPFGGSRKDIRSFAEEKQPESATEKAAVVAFFLDELAPPKEKRDSIGQEEITKYFKQAGFPLPASPSMTLVHAKNAGYFETVGAGQYRLNPVGYNLVVHRLPRAEISSTRTLRRKVGQKKSGRAVSKRAKK